MKKEKKHINSFKCLYLMLASRSSRPLPHVSTTKLFSITFKKQYGKYQMWFNLLDYKFFTGS